MANSNRQTRVVTRKFERRLLMVTAAWQILNGLLTVAVYNPFLQREGAITDGLTDAQQTAIASFFGSIRFLTITYGTAFIAMGAVNIYLAKKLSDHRVEKKLPIYLIVLGVASYLVMDILGGLLLAVVGVVMLAKNKPMERMNEALIYGSEENHFTNQIHEENVK